MGLQPQLDVGNSTTTQGQLEAETEDGHERDRAGRFVRGASAAAARRGGNDPAPAGGAAGDRLHLPSKVENERGERPGEELVRRLAELLGADPEELLALAGKVPPELRDRAQGDPEFARFLRRLPTASERELRALYRGLKMDQPK